MKTTNNKGFTLVELMIAITVFSVLLLLAGASMTQISRLYYKGVIVSKTQNVSRSIIDDISRTVQFSSVSAVAGDNLAPTYKSACIGNTRYTYVINKQIKTENDHALWKDKVSSSGACPPLDLSDNTVLESSNGTELLEPGMRLKEFSISTTSGTDIVDITVSVIYGDDDLVKFNDSAKTQPISCKGDVTGSQWCALSSLSTQVFSRAKS